MGEVYVWSDMDAGNWRAHRGKGKLYIETGWAQKNCWETGIFGTRKWMPEEGGGNLDTETRCMQEVVDAREVPVLKQ